MGEHVYPRAEVEAAFHAFVAAGDAGDWDRWADLHTEDGVWIEHHLGTFHGREAIRAKIKEAMAPVPMARVFFANSGSEAVDTALKIALAFWRARGEGQRSLFVGR